jgi:hypothetical protein
MRGVLKFGGLLRLSVMSSSIISMSSAKTLGTQAIPSSASTRKKELIGDFKNAGRTWRKEAEPVLVHGDCFDTPRFAVEAIGDWWFFEGLKRYRDAHRLLI